MDSFANRLNRALELRGMSAVDLSRKTGVFEGTISNYRRGVYKPKQQRLEQIAVALNVSIPWLMGIDAPMYEAPKTSGIECTDHEKAIIAAYRKNSGMQAAKFYKKVLTYNPQGAIL